jgi:hypothetical protein
MTLTKSNETDLSNDLKSIRVPPTTHQLPRINIETSSFWKKTKEYTIRDQ